MISWLQNWYQQNCDGDWEHSYGIKIETIDNPGWNVEIDFNETNLYVEDIPYTLVEKSENDWYGYSISNSVFSGAGDPQKLEMIISIFKKISERDL